MSLGREKSGSDSGTRALIPASGSSASAVTVASPGVLTKTLSFGLNGFFTSASIVANGKLLAALGQRGSGAAGLVAPWQSAILGAAIGFTYAAGLESGGHVGSRKYREAGQDAKMGWLLSILLGLLGSGVMLSTGAYFPSWFEEATAESAVRFFDGLSVGTPFFLMFVVDTQVAFNEGDWAIPPLAALFMFLVGASSGYALSQSAEMGPLGVGLGASIGQISTVAALKLWFALREGYHKYQLFTCGIDNVCDRFSRLFHLGWKISLQRLTEWGNLLVLSSLIGADSNNALKAAAPAIQYTALLGASFQSIAQAAGILISQEKARLAHSIEDRDQSAARGSVQKFRPNAYWNIGSGVGLGGVLTLMFYLLREPLAGFFLAENPSDEVQALAEALLWINMLGQLFDSGRLISMGALRGWKDILFPTIVSTLLMTVVGVPAGFGIGEAVGDDSDPVNSESAWIFYMRNIALLLTTLSLVARFEFFVRSDERKVEEISVSDDDTSAGGTHSTVNPVRDQLEAATEERDVAADHSV